MYCKIYKYWFLFCILLIFEECKKDPMITNEPEQLCEKLPPTPPLGWVFQTRNPKLNLQNARYSPQNDNLVFFLSHDSIFNYLLWSFNRQTKLKQLLDYNVFSSPSINKKGWVVYYKSDFNIYKIKINGDSLTKISNTSNFINPFWDETSNKIYCSNANNLQLYKINHFGIITDTIKNINSNVFIKDSLHVYIENDGTNQNIMLKNILKNNVTKLVINKIADAKDIIYGFFLSSNNKELFYYKGKGLFQVTLANLNIKKVVTSCDKEKYLDFSLSYFSGKFLTTKITSKVLNNTTLYNQYDLYEFDENLSNPVLINTP